MYFNRNLNLIFSIISFLSLNLLIQPALADSWTKPQRNETCITADAEVLMENGSLKAINEINTGDRIINFEGDVVTVLYGVKGPEKEEMFRITFSDDTVIKATLDHAFISADGMYLVSQELSVGQSLSGPMGDKKISSIERFTYAGDVYNLVLVDNHLFSSMDPSETLELNGKIMDSRDILRRKHPFLGLRGMGQSFIANGVANGGVIIQNGLKN